MSRRDSRRSIVYGFGSELNLRPRLQSRAAPSMTLNSYLVRGTLVGALGGLLFGFDTAVIAGTTHMLTQFYALSSGQLGFTVSSALIGTVIGAMLAGIPGQRIGRRDTLRILAVAYVVSAIG